MKFTLRHSDKLVGIFVLAGTLFLLGSLTFVGINNRWFQSDLEYHTHFNTAEGLSPGLALELRGFAIGRVKSLTLKGDNLVEVVFSVYQEYRTRIVPGSVVHLAVQPLGFGSNLVLYPGRSGGPPLPEGSIIPSSDLPEGRDLLAREMVDRPKRRDEIVGLLETLPPLIGQVESVVGTVDHLLARLDERLMGPGDQPGTGLLQTVDVAMQGADATVREFGNMAAQMDTTAHRLNQVLFSLAAFAKHLEDPEGLVPTLIGTEGTAAQLFQDNAQLYKHLTETMAELRELMVFMNRSTPEISVLMEESTSALAESEKVLQGLKNNPLLRGGIPTETKVPGTFGGYREEIH